MSTLATHTTGIVGINRLEQHAGLLGLIGDKPPKLVESPEIVLRFDYRDQPVETVDIAYPFTREVYLAKQRRADQEL